MPRQLRILMRTNTVKCANGGSIFEPCGLPAGSGDKNRPAGGYIGCPAVSNIIHGCHGTLLQRHRLGRNLGARQYLHTLNGFGTDCPQLWGTAEIKKGRVEEGNSTRPGGGGNEFGFVHGADLFCDRPPGCTSNEPVCTMHRLFTFSNCGLAQPSLPSPDYTSLQVGFGFPARPQASMLSLWIPSVPDRSTFAGQVPHWCQLRGLTYLLLLLQLACQSGFGPKNAC